MIKHLIISVFFILFCFYLTAQNFHTPVAAGYSKLTTYSSHHGDAFSFSGNQAALANAKNFSAGIYGERRFMLQELSLYNLAAALPTPSGNFGLRGSYYGNSEYNESQIGLAYGRNLGNIISIGAQFNYNFFQISGYGNSSAINFEAGIIFHVTEVLNIGLHAYNPTNARIGKNEEEKLPAVYTAGIGYDASVNFFFSGEIQKVEDQNVSINAGMQYKILDKIFARGGFTSATSSYYIGAGVMLKIFRIDATATLHPQLGITPGLMIIFNGNNKPGEK